jgi:hypothetical protein
LLFQLADSRTNDALHYAARAFLVRSAFRQLDEDLRDGLLVHASVQWTEVFRRAHRKGVAAPKESFRC